MLRTFTFILLMLACSKSWAQVLPGEWVVDVENSRKDRFQRELSAVFKDIQLKLLSPELAIYLVESNESEKLTAYLLQSDLVVSFGPNERLSTRGRVPNDALWESQWHLETIQADEAWETTTGGKHLNGKDIVVAVLDEGFDIQHEDLAENIYTNIDEIPDDGVDNDENGYIDDYRGISLDNGADDHQTNVLDSHGTAVSGIVGAVGDNDIGVPGLSWDAKVLPVSGIRTISTVIEGYQYVADQRRLWNTTNGAEGAYIVAANYSGGIDFASAQDPQYIPWCDMYDLLGSLGVVSTCSTTNRNTDVDALGDMPTTCTSPYLIAVTNTREDDQKVRDAGFGAISIDLAAPGGYTNELNRPDNVIQALEEGDKYGPFIGTSASAPLVAGTVALMYSTTCTGLQTLSVDLPSEAALLVRSTILASADKRVNLEGQVATGARLNVEAAVLTIVENCNTIPGAEEGLSVTRQANGSFTIDLVNVPFGTYTLTTTDAAGRVVMQQEVAVTAIMNRLITVDLGYPATGIYYFSIYNDMLIRTKPIFILN